jgi:hypothetical protein
MNEVKGIVELVKMGGTQDGALKKTDKIGFGSVRDLQYLQNIMHVMNEMTQEDCYVAINRIHMSVKKTDDIHNWQTEVTDAELGKARDIGLNNYLLYKTVNQLEKMTDPLNDMHDNERLCLLQCLILDMIRMPDTQITNPHEKRISFARELALKLDKPEYMMTLDELVHHVGTGTPGLYTIFDRPVEEGGLIGIRNLHGLSMKFYDKSMAFKMEASTRMKAGFTIFEDIGERYSKTGNAEMRV